MFTIDTSFEPGSWNVALYFEFPADTVPPFEENDWICGVTVKGGRYMIEGCISWQQWPAKSEEDLIEIISESLMDDHLHGLTTAEQVTITDVYAEMEEPADRGFWLELAL